MLTSHEIFYNNFILTFPVFRQIFLQSGANVEGSYSVSGTSCTIQWSTTDRNFRVYWDEGIGSTILFFKEELPNGNMVYDEYESDGVTYTGTFTFKDNSYRKGQYERNDGKKFNVKRKYP
jgi:hypothetical protein